MSSPHHRIEYPDGRVIEGHINRQTDVNKLGLENVNGLRVLDIATNDGFFAFWAEQHGASEVVAIDVGCYENYDWGFDGPDPRTVLLGQQNKWRWFDIHHKNLNSSVVKKEMSVYDIESLGSFDVIFNYGLLYHLRHPMLALDKCRAVCKGFMVLETSTSLVEPYLPVCIEAGEMTDIGMFTDTNMPTGSCVATWLKKACFPEVFVQRNIFKGRTTLVGVVDPKYMDWFSRHERCDEVYWEKVRKTSQRLFPQ